MLDSRTCLNVRSGPVGDSEWNTLRINVVHPARRSSARFSRRLAGSTFHQNQECRTYQKETWQSLPTPLTTSRLLKPKFQPRKKARSSSSTSKRLGSAERPPQALEAQRLIRVTYTSGNMDGLGRQWWFVENMDWAMKAPVSS